MVKPADRIMALIGPMSTRRVDEIECVASVLLAILFAHVLDASNVSWAAFSGYMVMRGHVADTLVRGLLRIVGTMAGGVLALAVIPFVDHRPVLLAVMLALVGMVGLYGAMTRRRAYAWLFFGLTFVMVALDGLDHPGGALSGFVQTRILEVLAGTVACVLVSLVSTFTLRRRWPAARSEAARSLGWHSHALRHAAQGGVALAVLVGVASFLAIPAVSQSAVTIMAVMLVPVSTIAASGLSMVSRRLVYRFIGCLAGAALGAAFLFAAQGSPPILIFGTMLGVAIGRHLENGGQSTSYVGTQFTLAILVTLVPDHYADAQIAPGVDRLFGVLIGLAVLEPLLIAWHLISPSRAQRSAERQDELGDI